MNKNKHLNLDTRIKIERGLNDQLSFKAIAASIGKDCTTVSKEIKKHVILQKKGAPYRPFNDCLHRKHCSHYMDTCSECNRKRYQ
ncbi:MAG: helix-turn-helix domain-containing protein [Lachnospiraceae bacterium]|nr:helix-turn-helix domain-containing protein [Lachnospiraceae bacterium]